MQEMSYFGGRTQKISSSVPCIPLKPSDIIATDASLSRWGVVANDWNLPHSLKLED